MPRACVCLLALGIAGWAWGQDPGFGVKPSAARQGEQVCIRFAVLAPTDVEVAVLNAQDQVVRHLAAGWLGAENPPPAPLKPGLEQELLWNGQGDWGLPAGSGPFKVRVRLGLHARFGGLVGDSPYNFNGMLCRGLHADPKSGELYLLIANADPATMRYALRVYDRDGKYLREIMPYPANVDAQSRERFGAIALPGAAGHTPRHYNSYPVLYPFDLSPFDPEQESTAMLSRQFGMLALHPDGHVLLVSDLLRSVYRIRMADGGAVSNPFAEPLWPEGTKLPGVYDNPVGPITGALAPDGKTFYLASYCMVPEKNVNPHPQWPEGRVYKSTLGQPGMQPFVDVALPATRAPLVKPGGGSAYGHQALHGLTVDARGRVFVCDAANGKVWVYEANGSPAGAVAVADAYACALDEKSGALYVLTCRPAPHARCHKSLVKLSGWSGDAKVLDTLAFPERGGSASPHLALDLTGPAPRLWVWGCPSSTSLALIEEREGRLKVVEDLAERGKLAAGFASHVEVDPEKDLVYVKQGAIILRYDGLTGAYNGPLGPDGRFSPIEGAEFCVRRDGMLYLSGNSYIGGGWAGGWRRLNRDLTPAAWPDGAKEAGYRTAKRHPLPAWWGVQGSCVTPDGRVYANAMAARRFSSVFEMAADGKAGRCPRMRDFFTPDPEGRRSTAAPGYIKAGYAGVLVGPLQDETGGVKVDQQGNLYVGIRVLPPEDRLPPDLAELNRLGKRFAVPYDRTIGSVVKFKPEGGALWPRGIQPGGYHKPVFFSGEPGIRVPEKFEAGLELGRATKLEKTFLEGAVTAYPGLSGFSSSCRCRTPRFEVDDYGRVYIPDALSCAVRVYDNAGNRIMAFGGYGNHDSQGPRSKLPAPEVPLVCPMGVAVSFKHIYVADEINRRVVRVNPAYAAEETCAVQ